MRNKFLKLAFLISALPVASCSLFSPEQDSFGGILVSTVSSTVGDRLGSKKAKTEKPAPNQSAARSARKALELINRTGRSGLLTNAPKLGGATVMVEEGRNGPYVTYRGTNNTSLTLRSGIVYASRGMGIDLIAQATNQPPAGLFTTGTFPKEYARAQRHLDGENRLQSADFLCVVTRTGSETLTIIDKKRATSTFEEVCKNDRRAFRNRYWVGSGSGTIWQSQQSISSFTGHVIIQYIAPK